MKLPALRERLQARTPAQDSDEPGHRAAVAAVLRDTDHGAELLFIRRSEDPRDPWSGHIAFPGGRRDETDEDLLMTATRETLEEVGLDLRSHGALLTRMEDVPAITHKGRMGLVIAPFVFELHRADAPLVHSDEVAETLWIPLERLARGEGASTFLFEWDGVKHELPCIVLEERKIWGLTHQMLQMLLAALT